MLPGTELLNCILAEDPVQMVGALLVMVNAGFGLMVTVNVNGVPVQVLFEGVKAKGVMVYKTTACAVAERLTSESMILSVPLAVFPVNDPLLTDEFQEYVLPAMVDVGVKFNTWLEQMVCVVFVAVLSGYTRRIIESFAVLLPQFPVALSVDEPDK